MGPVKRPVVWGPRVSIYKQRRVSSFCPSVVGLTKWVLGDTPILPPSPHTRTRQSIPIEPVPFPTAPRPLSARLLGYSHGLHSIAESAEAENARRPPTSHRQTPIPSSPCPCMLYLSTLYPNDRRYTDSSQRHILGRRCTQH